MARRIRLLLKPIEIVPTVHTCHHNQICLCEMRPLRQNSNGALLGRDPVTVMLRAPQHQEPLTIQATVFVRSIYEDALIYIPLGVSICLGYDEPSENGEHRGQPFMYEGFEENIRDPYTHKYNMVSDQTTLHGLVELVVCRSFGSLP